MGGLRIFHWAARVLAAAALLWGAASAQAPTPEALFQSFDARGLVPAEKRLLQTALAFQGRYNGLLDGKWGRGSQAAMERYTRAQFGEEPLNIHMAALVMDFARMREEDGWEMTWRGREMVSLAIPTKLIAARDRDGYRQWGGDEDGLTVMLVQGGVETALRAKRIIENNAADAQDVYRLLEERRFVTSAMDRTGRSFYARSERIAGLWTTVMILADPARKNAMNGIASSISFGAPNDWEFTDGGRLEAMVLLTAAALEQAQDAELAAAAPDRDQGGSGTGFYVSDVGEVLTNAHVVAGCARMVSGDRAFRIAAVDERGDLALLRPVSRFAPPAVAAFAAAPARLNADLTVAGYPLHGILGGLNVTRGALTSASGLGGDSTTMQISAPVQPGNSGGPVIDADGLVTGVVVSKLDAIKIAGAIGDLPQNVNFAIRGAVAKLFLSVHGVEFRVGIPRRGLDPATLAEQAARYTILLECK